MTALLQATKGPTSANKKAKTAAGVGTSNGGLPVLRFEGHLHFRQRLLLATLTGRGVRIDKIRENDDTHPGLADYEVSFLRLLEKVTNGSVVQISYTGTSVEYRPGVITGGRVAHDCGTTRGIGYYLEVLVVVGLFGKARLHATLTGVTNANSDVGVDVVRTAVLPLVARFVDGAGDAKLRVVRRGAVPLGGGVVEFETAAVRRLRAVGVDALGGGAAAGLGVRRIRGIAYATRVSPQLANRVVASARALLTRYIPDVFLYADVYRGQEAGLSPGYGLSLVAETTSNVLYSAECDYQRPKNSVLTLNLKEGDDIPDFSLGQNALDNDAPETTSASSAATATTATQDGILAHLQNDYSFPTPEDLGIRAARLLLTEIRKGGSVDSVSQWLAILLLALGPEDVAKLRLGSLTPFSVQLLRDIKTFLGVVFKITQEQPVDDNIDEETGRTKLSSLKGGIILTCVGCGYVNVNKN
ncbi:hypothetical protein HK100_008319, partial [Physocladia obscura]